MRVAASLRLRLRKILRCTLARQLELTPKLQVMVHACLCEPFARPIATVHGLHAGACPDLATFLHAGGTVEHFFRREQALVHVGHVDLARLAEQFDFLDLVCAGLIDASFALYALHFDGVSDALDPHLGLVAAVDGLDFRRGVVALVEVGLVLGPASAHPNSGDPASDGTLNFEGAAALVQLAVPEKLHSHFDHAPPTRNKNSCAFALKL
jgi:hypothetical protein